MKKINIIKMTETFNRIRQENVKKLFLREELFSLLSKEGFNKSVIERLISKGVIKTQRDGGNVHRKFYTFQETPLYIGKLDGVYQALRSYRRPAKKQPEEPTIEIEVNKEELSPIEKVKLDGYKVYRQVFDMEKFRKDYPELYESYLKLEEV